MRKLGPMSLKCPDRSSGSILAKGYGFILPDDALPDILLHVTCLRRSGLQAAYEGSRIVCDVVRTAKGLQAQHIRSMDEFNRDPSSAASAAHPRCCPARERLGKSGG